MDICLVKQIDKPACSSFPPKLHQTGSPRFWNRSDDALLEIRAEYRPRQNAVMTAPRHGIAQDLIITHIHVLVGNFDRRVDRNDALI